MATVLGMAWISTRTAEVSTRFDYCLRFIAKWEGGFVDDPADRGGRTNLGITQATLDQYNKVKGMPSQDVAVLSEKKAREIYFDNYWMPAKCGQMPEPLDLIVFDTAVNMGVGRSARFLQMALGIELVDGVIGPKTMKALHEEISAGRVEELCDLYMAARRGHYQRIVEKDETQQKFIKGWMNRLNDLAMKAQQDVA